jgi:hypothetical protein
VLTTANDPSRGTQARTQGPQAGDGGEARREQCPARPGESEFTTNAATELMAGDIRWRFRDSIRGKVEGSDRGYRRVDT